MNIIRGQMLKILPSAQETYGYITKAVRQELGLEKTHANDAFVIAGGRKQKRLSPISMFASLTDAWRFAGLTELLVQTKKQ